MMVGLISGLACVEVMFVISIARIIGWFAWMVVGEAIRSCKILFLFCLLCFLFWSHFLVHLITSRRRMTKDTISMISQMGTEEMLWEETFTNPTLTVSSESIPWSWLSFFLHMVYSLAGLGVEWGRLPGSVPGHWACSLVFVSFIHWNWFVKLKPNSLFQLNWGMFDEALVSKGDSSFL